MSDFELEYVYGQLFEAEDLCESGLYEDAIEVCDELLLAWGESEDEDLSTTIAEALLCRGRSLAALDRFEEELEAYDEIVIRFGLDDSPEIIVSVAEARFNAAVAVGQLDCDEESIDMYDAFIRHYERDRIPLVQEMVIRARYNRAIAIRYSQGMLQALPHLNEILSLYGASDEPEYDVTVLRTLISKASIELFLRRPQDSIKSATLFLKKCDFPMPVEQLHCHLILAGSHLISKDMASFEEHIARVLELLPEVEGLPPADNFNTMIRYMAVPLGLDRTLELILKSKAAKMLSPEVKRLKRIIQMRSDRMIRIKETAKELRTDFELFHHTLN